MDSTCAIVHWLNNNPAAVTGIATAVTAIATVVIAWASFVSSRLVRLEKKIERANRMPILTFAEERRDDYRELYVKNIGYGPALNIVRMIIEAGSLLSHTRLRERLPLGSLAPGEKVCAFSATLRPNASVAILDQLEFHAVVECDDVIDGHWEVVFQNRTHSTPTPITKRKMPPSQAHRV
jgi:hypothetical protein